MVERKYRVRQAILLALQDAAPAGRDLASLESAGPCLDVGASRDEIEREARFLELAGFCGDLRGRGRPAYWKITYVGSCQIRKEVALEEAVWGDEAL